MYWLLSFPLGTERVHVSVVAVLPGHNYHGCSSNGSGPTPVKASSLLGYTAQELRSPGGAGVGTLAGVSLSITERCIRQGERHGLQLPEDESLLSV